MSSAASIDLIRFQSWPTRRQCQLYRLLLVMAAPTRPALTGHGLGHNTGPRIRIFACRLLQHFVGKCAESGHWQVATGNECCCSCSLQYSRVRPRFVAAPALRASLTRCARQSSVQTRGRNVCMTKHLTDLCIPVSDVSARQHHRSVTRRLLVIPRCRLSTLGPRAFSVAGPSLWNSLTDSLRDPDLGRDSFRRLLKTHLFSLYWSI